MHWMQPSRGQLFFATTTMLFEAGDVRGRPNDARSRRSTRTTGWTQRPSRSGFRRCPDWTITRTCWSTRCRGTLEMRFLNVEQMGRIPLRSFDITVPHDDHDDHWWPPFMEGNQYLCIRIYDIYIIWYVSSSYFFFTTCEVTRSLGWVLWVVESEAKKIDAMRIPRGQVPGRGDRTWPEALVERYHGLSNCKDTTDTYYTIIYIYIFIYLIFKTSIRILQTVGRHRSANMEDQQRCNVYRICCIAVWVCSWRTWTQVFSMGFRARH